VAWSYTSCQNGLHEMAKKKNAVRIRMVVQWINRKLAAKGQILMATRKMKMKQLWQRSAR
jgi:hypothetical protein